MRPDNGEPPPEEIGRGLSWGEGDEVAIFARSLRRPH